MLIATHLIGFAAGGEVTYAKGSNLNGAGTNIGSMTSYGGLAAAFDGTTAQNGAAGAVSPTATTASYCGKDFSASPKRIWEARTYGATDGGYLYSSTANVTLNLRGKNGGAPGSSSDGTLLATATFADTENQSNDPRIFTNPDPTVLWDYVWIEITSASLSHFLAELQLYEAVPA